MGERSELVRSSAEASSMAYVSVIIPTRNRARSLRRLLEALDRQACAPDSFEVIVAANDCADDTVAMVRACTTLHQLRLVEILEPGTARARNRAAAIARGTVLLFLDDDSDPLPGLVEAHARAHEPAQNLVALGRMLGPPGAAADLFAERLRDLELRRAARRAEAGEQLNWVHVNGSNVSMSKSLFEQIGGYNDLIVTYGSEDYELGYRAQRAGASFVFLPDANAYNYRAENTSIVAYLRKARSAGRNDTIVLRRHPEIARELMLGRAMRQRSRRGRLGWTLAFDHPRFGDAIAGALFLAGDVLARPRLRRRWNRLVDWLWEYWYLRGVTDMLGNGTTIAMYLADLPRATVEDGRSPAEDA